MIRIICDRCGKEINQPAIGDKLTKKPSLDIGYIAWNFRRGFEGDIAQDNIFEEKHFCRQCMKEIRDFIQKKPAREESRTGGSARCGTAPEAPGNTLGKPEAQSEKHENVTEKPKTETEKPKTGTKKKARIDIGKVMALRKAGWSNAKIADEMGVEPQSVAGAIWRYKKRQEEAGDAPDEGRSRNGGEPDPEE